MSVLMERERKLAEKVAVIITKPMAAYIPGHGFNYATIDKEMATEMAKAIIPCVLAAVARGDIPLDTDEYEEVGLDHIIFEKDLEIRLEVGDRVIALREKGKKEGGEKR